MAPSIFWLFFLPSQRYPKYSILAKKRNRFSRLRSRAILPAMAVFVIAISFLPVVFLLLMVSNGLLRIWLRRAALFCAEDQLGNSLC